MKKCFWLMPIVLISTLMLAGCDKVSFRNSPGYKGATHKIYITSSIIETQNPNIYILTAYFELDKERMVLKVPEGLISSSSDKDSNAIRVTNAEFSCPVGCLIRITSRLPNGKYHDETIEYYP